MEVRVLSLAPAGGADPGKSGLLALHRIAPDRFRVAMTLDSNGLEILSREECARLLRTVPIGRVVTTVRALPVALPVNYAVIEDSICFRSSPGTKLHAAVRKAVVGFEVDAFDSATRTGWSVLIVGGSREVEDPDRIAQLERDVPRPWAPGPFSSFIRVEMVQVTGRRITGTDHGAPPEHASIGASREV